MPLDIAQEIAALRLMTVGELKQKYAEVFGEAARSGNKQWLIKRIAWRMQANAEGDLSERARQRALELADDADLRVKAPRSIPPHGPEPEPQVVESRIPLKRDERLPLPGSVITRNYKGRCLCVTVRTNGFEFDGKVYPSLTSVARAITGKHWNGFHFFGLHKNGRAE